MRTRLLVGATFSIACRNWFMQGALPTRRAGRGVSALSALTSRRSRECSSARSATNVSRSALNGFSMKS